MVLFVVTLALLALQTSALSNDTLGGADRLAQPAPTFAYHRNATFDAVLTQSVDPAFKGKKWDDAPEVNVKTFTAAFAHTQFKTLGSMISSVVPTCDNTLATGKRVNVSSLTSMIWQNDETRVGFSHHGPCEAWIDTKRVFRADCCRQSFSGYPAEIPIDFSTCHGKCRFTFYWLTLDQPEWQAYKQCVPIFNSNASRSNSTEAAANATASANATVTLRSNDPTDSTAGRVHAAAAPTIKVESAVHSA